MIMTIISKTKLYNNYEIYYKTADIFSLIMRKQKIIFD